MAEKGGREDGRDEGQESWQRKGTREDGRDEGLGKMAEKRD